MSWIYITLIILGASFACAFGLCEWLVGRRSPGQDNDHDSFA